MSHALTNYSTNQSLSLCTTILINRKSKEKTFIFKDYSLFGKPMNDEVFKKEEEEGIAYLFITLSSYIKIPILHFANHLLLLFKAYLLKAFF